MAQTAYLLVRKNRSFQVKVDNAFNRVRFNNKIITYGTFIECMQEKLLMETYFK